MSPDFGIWWSEHRVVFYDPKKKSFPKYPFYIVTSFSYKLSRFL